ncbi:MAG: MazG-like family protein [Anaerolineales bacterium]|jgi:NTP pyrophosphatase (non-canonical NTP hydrolase)
MDLKELTAEMNRFVRAKGWYGPGTSRPQTPRSLASSLVIEAAEVLEHFQWGDEPRPGIEEELADVALYLLQLASLLGVDLEKAILSKLDRNYSRTWQAGPGADQ